MATNVVLAADELAISKSSIPWYIWASVAAVTSAVVGVQWDISWHRSIGRDTFWTPAHLAIYACGVIAGICCGYLILATTFGRLPAMRAASVKMWGFRGPLGAFISAWGGVAMLTSAPFDNWWHNAYGLDVKILSPPHVLLALGINAVILGALILVLGFFNRAEGGAKSLLCVLLLYLGGASLTMLMTVSLEYSGRVLMHSAIFYRTMAIVAPLVLVAVGKASNRRRGSTIVAAVYMALFCGLIWILPLFPAEPKLGPVYNKVTQFIPPPFPILLVIPAFALDLLWPRVAGWKKWAQAAIGGVVFLLALLAVQWPFADFLMSSASENLFFGTMYHDYLTPPRANEMRALFFHWEKTPLQFWEGMAIALIAAILMTRLGLAAGDWMRRVRR